MVKEYFCQFARSYLRPVLSSCLSYIFLIYQFSFKLTSRYRLFLGYVFSKMSHAGSDSDSFLDLLNDSLEKNDIGSAGDSDYIEKSDNDTSSEFRGTFSSESETEEVMNERSDP
ncbi:hypothetical protein T07_9208 [Trichinella nelsoni]|uniref:Uncharacterized protein n=1 Tax=Trichinella nelsoni TaxID=6336 RepID=A0A0V0S286_9BILA|nr:hypothetical protein T07_9208 [Trichinella nelsoni]